MIRIHKIYPFQFLLFKYPIKIFVKNTRNAVEDFPLNQFLSAIEFDSTRPVITGCPDDIEVTAPIGTNSAVVTWTEPRATDNSGGQLRRARTKPPGSVFDVGTTKVTYGFLNEAGSTALCTFEVTVSSKYINVSLI